MIEPMILTGPALVEFACIAIIVFLTIELIFKAIEGDDE